MKNINISRSISHRGWQALLFTSLFITLFSCKKDYIEGGSISNVDRFAGVSTYEALQQMPQFDTLVQLIDAAGIQDAVNKAGTVFAPTNGSVRDYLEERTLFLQNTVDQSKFFLLDSLNYYLKNNISGTKDSLLMYLIPEQLTPQNVTMEGTVYSTGLTNDKVMVSFEETKDGNMGYTDLISSVPRLLYYAQIWDGQGDPQENKILVKTAFIKTKSGSINALDPGHVLFFYGR